MLPNPFTKVLRIKVSASQKYFCSQPHRVSMWPPPSHVVTLEAWSFCVDTALHPCPSSASLTLACFFSVEKYVPYLGQVFKEQVIHFRGTFAFGDICSAATSNKLKRCVPRDNSRLVSFLAARRVVGHLPPYKQTRRRKLQFSCVTWPSSRCDVVG